MEYEKLIHAIIDPIVENKDAVLIRELAGATDDDVDILIAADKEDTSRLIGRKGTIANAIREIVSIGGKKDNKHIHIRFESFDDDGENKED